MTQNTQMYVYICIWNKVQEKNIHLYIFFTIIYDPLNWFHDPLISYKKQFEKSWLWGYNLGKVCWGMNPVPHAC
jgi:hypothetical protein